MSYKTIQKQVIKVIKPAIRVRICDSCGGEIKKGEVTRPLWVTGIKGVAHYHRNTECDPWRNL